MKYTKISGKTKKYVIYCKKCQIRRKGMNNTNNRKKRRTSGSNITLILILAAVILLLLNIFIFSGLKSDSMPRDNADLRENAGANPADPTPGASGQGGNGQAGKKDGLSGYTPVSVSPDEIHFGELVLINNDTAYVSQGTHNIVAYETPAKVYSLKNKNYSVSYPEYVFLNPTVIENLNTMFTDYVAFTGKADIFINEAHRTLEDQQKIYDQKGADIATKPGYSEHHSGYAFDVAVLNVGTITDTGHYVWLPENCKNYGFIRRYPEGKKEITGIDFEAWHYRYVGIPHSVYIMDKHITLEEYIKLLKGYTLKGNHLKIVANGAEYEVYYVPVTDETKEIYVPKDKPYSVSGNNVDGFIVTVTLSQPSETPEETPEE